MLPDCQSPHHCQFHFPCPFFAFWFAFILFFAFCKLHFVCAVRFVLGFLSHSIFRRAIRLRHEGFSARALDLKPPKQEVSKCQDNAPYRACRQELLGGECCGILKESKAGQESPGWTRRLPQRPSEFGARDDLSRGPHLGGAGSRSLLGGSLKSRFVGWFIWGHALLRRIRCSEPFA